jgi:hypothetical protein
MTRPFKAKDVDSQATGGTNLVWGLSFKVKHESFKFVNGERYPEALPIYVPIE